MKQKLLHIVYLTLALAGIGLFAGCTEDSQQDTPEMPQRQISFMLCSPNYIDVSPMSSPRRALPPGYVVYDNLSPQIPGGSTALKCFLAHTAVDFQGDITYDKVSSTYIWNSKLPVDESTYYVYGLMPASEANKVDLQKLAGETDYSAGAKMVMEMNAMSGYDVCAIVGMKASQTNLPISEVDLTKSLGKFEYNAANDGDFVYLLIDHLYAALHLRFKIDGTYNQLRTIKLTKLSLRSKNYPKANLIATLTANSSSPLSVSTTKSGSAGEGAEVVIFDGEKNNEERELKWEETNMIDFLACTAAFAENNAFVLKTKYNVYDKNGNLIRKGCEAENKLSLPTGITLDPGQKYVFNLTVNPTYLYVLSEPDLDNPTVTVN
jgi:hypothetical protein